MTRAIEVHRPFCDGWCQPVQELMTALRRFGAFSIGTEVVN